MKNLLFLSLMVHALVASVFSVKCYSCSSTNRTCEKVIEIECLGGQCFTASERFYNGVKTFELFLKGCACDELCGGQGRATGENIEYQFNGVCCTGDDCNIDEFRLPDNKIPNGLQCPTCYNNISTDECVSDMKVNCTGNQVLCYDYRASMQNPDGSVLQYSSKGCANKFVCDVNFDKHIGLIELYREHLNCTAPNPDPQ
ncbi:hypothetical protein GDO81_026366 [Engystomops pustulosus]|uniref:UPAR/Ly6 domain-containing protein n=1 Tax=Engystomops pustulosus TaxID=76066 RepID=A0AAV6ZLD6_ENGPU|nr:hypothetical protein GDO81_026366 [Engystomops pustulosus]